MTYDKGKNGLPRAKPSFGRGRDAERPSLVNDAELDPLEQRLVLDGPGVRGSAAKRFTVAFA